jgi:uncharacterized protein (DUF4415 family)
MKIEDQTQKRTKTDWDRLSRMTEDEIEAGAADDPDNPFLDDDSFTDVQDHMPQSKTPISIRLDQGVLDWFKSQGPGYQSRINAVLRGYIAAQNGVRRKRG